MNTHRLLALVGITTLLFFPSPSLGGGHEAHQPTTATEHGGGHGGEHATTGSGETETGGAGGAGRQHAQEFEACKDLCTKGGGTNYGGCVSDCARTYAHAESGGTD